MTSECPECGSEHKTERAMRIHHAKAHPDLFEQRFWMRVEKGDPDECWEWQGARSESGHGQINKDGETRSAHAIALELSGRPPGEKWALHGCDNPPCVNPNHLYVGTPKDNSQDRERRDRREVVKGETHGRAELDEDDVREIRRRSESGDTHREIAEDYAIGRSQVSLIANKKRWSHVE